MDGSATALTFTELHRSAIRSEDAAPSICRICRGEGTPEEPLFFPCKCSGSIKYVHQDCLMEWLSHSQKKYCELCKTSFRFTKLYAPDMPQSLPIHVFLGHMTKYIFRNLLVWLRGGIAVSVWLGGLPYFMRSVWSFLFWVSDEGLGGSSILTRSNSPIDAVYELASSVPGLNTCPASPLLVSMVTPASAAETFLRKASENDISALIIGSIFGSIGKVARFNRSDATIGFISNSRPEAESNLFGSGPSSLLGDVTFLHNLTRNSALNRAIIAILEGQIITVLVIVCFILVILVRDYVVQQQPEINMRAAFAAPANPPPPAPPPPEPLNIRPEEVENLRGPDESDDSDEGTLDNESPLYQRRGSGFGEGHELRHRFTNRPTDQDSAGSSDVVFSGALPSSDRSDISIYTSIASRANFDPEKIIDIIEEEGLEERLAFWVDANRRFVRDRPPIAASFEYGPRFNSQGPDASESITQGSPRTPFNPEYDEDTLERLGEWGSSRSRKGKEREDNSSLPRLGPQDSGSASSLPGPSRPRAISDGPQLHDSIHPFANNSWSFAALPPEPEPQDDEGEDFFDQRADPPPYDRADFLSEAESLRAARAYQIPSLDELTGPIEVQDLAPPRQVEADQRELGQVQGLEQNVGLVERVTDFMWGDLENPQDVVAEDAAPVENDPEDDPWVDVDDFEDGEGNANGQPGGGEGGAAPGLDAEAIDDLEDFEGVMELIGMRGPIAGLFQNAIFCAVLVGLTILTCVFLPYNIGRVSVWILANPMRLVRLLFELSKLLQDAAVLLTGIFSWFALNIVDMFTGRLGGSLAANIVSLRKASWSLWTTAGSRVLEYVFMDFPMSPSEMQNFSAISHGALLTIKAHLASAFSVLSTGFTAVFGGFAIKDSFSPHAVVSIVKSLWITAHSFLAALTNPSSWVIDLSETEKISAINPQLAYWSGLDRFWAILAGYFTLFTVGALYLKRGSPISQGNMMQAWEAGIIDTLHQASGIMKVILIISIEMLVFPLYCGLLLDGALLPLFEDATFKSRILFTYNYPLTSIFVHWFVGTGYMFHFALFVSMCRKIMRQGVLYFIRDPDDPEFHPVRDVLERNLATQLRKILFSAFVYGALVIVCLGGVVWGLWFTTSDVLPVHYSSNEPVLEFPVDLLFYNFLMPLAVNFFKPGDGLHAMYTWWFRKCARGLRLTFFLFGERKIDEEGILHLGETTDGPRLPWYRTWLLEVDEEEGVVPMTWKNPFEDEQPQDESHISHNEASDLSMGKALLRDMGQLEANGRFVRAPASDRIRIPKGRKVFLDVSEDDVRTDGQPDTDLYASDQYQMVYIPPHFRLRVFLFILFIWVFAAVTGVGFTIIPLLFGRKMFQTLIPGHIRTNDIYAFSIGVYLLGSLLYSFYWLARQLARPKGQRRKTIWAHVRNAFKYVANSQRIKFAVANGARLAYAYFFILVVFPLLISTIMELYLMIPLHTYMYPPTAASVQASRAGASEASRHTVRVVQCWTLGLLYAKLGARVVTSLFRNTRLATAVDVVLSRGWLHPDLGTLTRAFVIPGLAIAAIATVGPPVLTSVLLKYGLIPGAQGGVNEAAEAARLVIIYRLSYPMVAMAAIFVKNTIGLIRVFRGWSARIRDEAYLIGERLHNFGAAAAGARRVRGAWRAGGARL